MNLFLSHSHPPSSLQMQCASQVVAVLLKESQVRMTKPSSLIQYFQKGKNIKNWNNVVRDEPVSEPDFNSMVVALSFPIQINLLLV